tara:strand:+ start:2961 stop:3986 length:1026 start_codon:yes stop_codon:yes gene_type:complete
MKILVTGNLGYIGSVLVPILLEKGYDVVGYDIGYYEECLLYKSEQKITQIKKDIRDVNADDLIGIDAIIHLAALSNDPLGELSPGLTENINLDGTLKIAELAKKVGVKRFVYSSSQSMYGISNFDGELDEYDSEKNPITSYAKTKWDAELALNKLVSKDFIVVSFRPSTVFGASPRLRCDIVFNNLVACAYTTGKIEIKSDGSPIRPVVHVKDVCNAYIAGLNAPENIISGKSFNVGILNGNFTVKELAEAAQRSVPGSELIFTGEHGNDARTYRVSFKRILSELKDYFKPEWDLDKGGTELVELFKKTSFKEHDFRGKKTTRLSQLNYLTENNIIDLKIK